MSETIQSTALISILEQVLNSLVDFVLNLLRAVVGLLDG